ncbi:hypothetical protein PSACC_02738 [Paramicrosporidium saccamoebae]|uniref:Splicing factor Cactin n=1 Tax=Paramicrosporidium saccamoebae TaxID=1246581 RepID=A0A2H9TI60_9FUNG|nr:hypothetical protein PSACC_02738 [Paramicrosporidium saccamoebae]
MTATGALLLSSSANRSASINDTSIGGEGMVHQHGRERSPDRRDAENWQHKERQFHRKQLVERAKVRLGERRETCFDVLLLNTVKCGIFSDRNPAKAVQATLEVVENILEVLEYEEDPTAREYWKALQAWVDFQRNSPQTGTRTNVSVRDDIRDMLGKKNYEELCRLEVQVKRKLQEPEVDPDYWGGLLLELKEFKLREWLVECNKRLLVLRRSENADLVSIEAYSASIQSERKSEKPDQPIVTNWDESLEALRLYESHLAMNGETDQILFDEEVNITQSRGAIKPRYVNWVTMKVEWTKYNLAHYTNENPPAPTPQAFAFNLFYPQLRDPTRVPTYTTEPDPSHPDTYQLLRFSGGPPYADLVFRLPAHRWELGHRQGFRCTFERSTLSLEFQFKRQFYR